MEIDDPRLLPFLLCSFIVSVFFFRRDIREDLALACLGRLRQRLLVNMEIFHLVQLLLSILEKLVNASLFIIFSSPVFLLLALRDLENCFYFLELLLVEHHFGILVHQRGIAEVCIL